MGRHFETLCVHGRENDRGQMPDAFGAVAVPVYQTASFAHPGVGQSAGFDYTRESNPTRHALERVLAALEDGCDALAFSSGMAALAAVTELFSPGDRILASEDLYGGTVRLFETLSRKNGPEIVYVDTGDPAAAENFIDERAKALFVETPSNPGMRITDLRAAAELCRRLGLLLIVDNTFLSPALQKPLTLGADLVIHSATKYLGGHNDTVAGAVVCKDPEIAERLRLIAKTSGAALSPFDSWLILRGIKTLALRTERQQQTAGFLAEKLRDHRNVTRVLYPGLPEHPGHRIHRAQSAGDGAMISFYVKDRETALRALERVRLILFAESLGGTETLITYPCVQTHAFLSEERRAKLGIDERLLRLSVGTEHPDDLWEDLSRALDD